jgi:hypothetical protein
MTNRRIRKTRALLFVAAALAALAGPGIAGGNATAAVPPACKLLTRAEAQTLAGIKLEPPVGYPTNCTYSSYPTESVGQVSIYVDSTVPRTLRIDRALHHTIWSVPRLGNQAFEEQWHIFVRKGSVWLTINLVRIDVWPPYRKRLEHAAAIAISRVGPAARRTAGLRTTAAAHAPPALGARGRWSGNELRYGGSITHYRGIVYQPDVVLIGGGANAIRSRSPDGLTWTIAGSAPGAADLRVGKIMLATTFASGRVLELTRVGPNLQVVLGPVALTDIIRDGDFESSAPIPLGKPLVYQTAAPKPPAGRRTTQGISAGSGAGGFSAAPICCSGGIGMHIGYNSASGRLSAAVRLYVERPSVDFHIRIGGGRLIDAGLQLHGVGGLRYYIFGATLNGSGDVRSGPITVPGSVTIPLAGPLAITLTQAFDVSMQFAGRATVKAVGDYAISGGLGFGYQGGGPQADATAMTTKAPITENTLSLGVGENAISLGWSVRATVGIGVGGFSAGAWFALRPGLAVVADGSNLLSLEAACTTADLDVSDMYGVGYTIPEYARSVINAVLGVLHVKPIPASGGPSWGPFTIWRPPRSDWCPPRK